MTRKMLRPRLDWRRAENIYAAEKWNKSTFLRGAALALRGLVACLFKQGCRALPG